MKLQVIYLADNTGEETTLDVTEIFLYKEINTKSYPVNDISFDFLIGELDHSNQLNVWTDQFAIGQVDTIKGPVDVRHGQREAIRLTKDDKVVWERKTPTN